MRTNKIIIYHSGSIITMDPLRPSVDAVAVVGGRIAAMGSTDDVVLAVGKGAQSVDLKNRTLLPGFIDGHSHFPSGGMNRLYAADLGVADMQELKDALRKKLHEKRPSEWVIGHSFDEMGMDEKRYPTCKELDEVSTEVPIFFRHITGHAGVANSRALAMAGITRDTPNPAGGIIAKYPGTNEPNGILEGIPAQSLVRRLIPHFTKEEMKAAVADDSRLYASYGVTTAQGGPAFSPMDAELGTKVTDLMLECAADGTLAIRAVLFIRANDMSRLEPYPYHVSGADISGNGRVTLEAAKLWADGDPRGHTGYFSTPYAVEDPEKGPDYRGEFLYTREELAEKIIPMHRAGWQIAIHANGDEGIETVLRAYETAQKSFPRHDPRHLVIHAQYARKDQLERMAGIGACPCFFISPLWYWAEIHGHYVGDERVQRFCPCKDAEDLDLIFNLHTDAPITPINPLVQVGVAVTRTSRKGNLFGPDQAVSVQSALRAVTLGAAYHNFEEHKKGSLTPGKYADMVILEQNPLKVPIETIKDIRVLETIVGGETVYVA